MDGRAIEELLGRFDERLDNLEAGLMLLVATCSNLARLSVVMGECMLVDVDGELDKLKEISERFNALDDATDDWMEAMKEQISEEVVEIGETEDIAREIFLRSMTPGEGGEADDGE